MTAPTNPAAPSALADAPLWLKQPDQHWQDFKEFWIQQERRLYGGVLVLDELTAFDVEDATAFDLRRRTARYPNLPDRHMSLNAGHLMRAMPEIDFGSPDVRTGWGTVRPRTEIKGTFNSLAEIFNYNIDGIGQDGAQFRTWCDGVIKRAGATGYRYVMVEMPRQTTLAEIRRRAQNLELATTRETRLAQAARLAAQPLTEADRAAGWHPYTAEWSPLTVIRRSYTEGTLDYAVARLKLPATAAVESGWTLEQEGIYVLVRRGYELLGEQFADGGWWLFDQAMRQVDAGDWNMTRGQIPLVLALAEQNPGTSEEPAIGRSLTHELGQIAVDVMNARSEQRYNARQAAKSIILLMGAGGKEQKATAAQMVAGSMVVAVPPLEQPDGQLLVPQLAFGSNVAMDTAVYTNIIKEALDEARELMIAQHTSEPDSSGESKKAGFEEQASPLLSRMAGALETWVNSILHFYALRAGIPPTASLTMPKRFELRSILTDVDKMIASLKESALDAPSWMADMLIRKGDELGLIPQEKRDDIIKELQAAQQRHGALQPAEYWTQMSLAIANMVKIPGMTPQGAGFLLGLTPEQVDVLRQGVPPGETPGGPNAAPTVEEAQRRADMAQQRFQPRSASDGQPEGAPAAPADPQANDQPGDGGQPPAFRRAAQRARAAG